MNKLFKFYLPLLMSCMFLCFFSPVWCIITEQQKAHLLNKVKAALLNRRSSSSSSSSSRQIRVNSDQSAKNLLRRIKQPKNRRNKRNIYFEIINAQESAINSYVVTFLITSLPSISVELFELLKRIEPANVITYNSFITAAGKYIKALGSAGKINDAFNIFKTVEKTFNEIEKRREADVITYNSFITAAGACIKVLGSAGKINDAFNIFKTVEKTFNEIEKRREADVITHNSFITAAREYIKVLGSTGKINEAHKIFKTVQKTFNEIEKRREADVITYSSFITAAGECIKALRPAGAVNVDKILQIFIDLQTAFNEIREVKINADVKAKIIAYSSFITASGECIKALGSAGAVNVDKILQIFIDLQTAFNEIKNMKEADIITYSSFITAAGKCIAALGSAGAVDVDKILQIFLDLQATFNKIKNMGKANVIVYNSLITAAGEHIKALGSAGKINEAHKIFKTVQKTFNEINNIREADVITYNSFITAAGECIKALGPAGGVNVDKNQILAIFKELQNAFINIKSSRKADIITFSSFITAAGECIKALGSAGEINETHKIFKTVQKTFNEINNIREADVKSSFIIAAGEYIKALGSAGKINEAHKIFKTVQKTFNKIKKIGKAGVFTHNNFITAAGKCINALGSAGEINEAHKIFKTVQKTFNEINNIREADVKANIITYSSFITAAGKCIKALESAGKINEAHKIFKTVQNAFEEAKNMGQFDFITYNSFMDVLVKLKYWVKAKEIFSDYYLEEYREYKEINLPLVKEFNLHGFSYGPAYMACEHVINSVTPEQNITFIVGQCRHSTGNNSPVRNGVKDCINDNIGKVKQVPNPNHGIIAIKLLKETSKRKKRKKKKDSPASRTDDKKIAEEKITFAEDDYKKSDSNSDNINYEKENSPKQSKSPVDSADSQAKTQKNADLEKNNDLNVSNLADKNGKNGLSCKTNIESFSSYSDIKEMIMSMILHGLEPEFGNIEEKKEEIRKLIELTNLPESLKKELLDLLSIYEELFCDSALAKIDTTHADVLDTENLLEDKTSNIWDRFLTYKNSINNFILPFGSNNLAIKM